MKKLLKLRKKKSNGTVGKNDRSSPVETDVDMASSSTLTAMSSLSNSNPSLASLSLGRPVSHPGTCSSAREDVVNIAIDIQGDLANMQKEYLSKRDHIRQMLESDSKGSSLQPNMAVLMSLRQALRQAQVNQGFFSSRHLVKNKLHYKYLSPFIFLNAIWGLFSN